MLWLKDQVQVEKQQSVPLDVYKRQAAYKNWDEEVYQEYINKYRLDPKQKIDTLSQGMKMKYALALALSCLLYTSRCV